MFLTADEFFFSFWLHLIQQYGIVQLKNGQYFGTKVALSLWNPQPADRQMFSLSQFWVAAGTGPNLNTIESGWMVSTLISLIHLKTICLPPNNKT